MGRENPEEHGIPKSIILVTGGAGYIGSHCVLLLLNQNYRVVVIDDCLSTITHTSVDKNGNLDDLPESLHRVQLLTGRKLVKFYKCNLLDTDAIDQVFRAHEIETVIHFAALKSVSDSLKMPLEYYSNNLIGTINLLKTMKLYGCVQLIFSSSATVYGTPQYLPVDEQHPVGMNILNPYGQTKCMIEQILRDVAQTKMEQNISTNTPNRGWKIISLRYFNPIGAHSSGLLGEHPEGTPCNIMPYISQVAIGKQDKVYVFGNDFETVDGTGVRDYVHIMDLADAHTHALKMLLDSSNQTATCFYKTYNVGTGKGYSVLELINGFQTINKVSIPYEVVGRREGDASEVYADVGLIKKELGWSSRLNLNDMVRDTYNWQRLNPEGYKSHQTGFEGFGGQI